jgi:hypothetical protein
MGEWTAGEIPDQSGRTIVVTGANSGLGFEATKALSRAGARVVMACRSSGRGERAAEEIRADVPDATLDVRECDLADLDSIATFGSAFRESYDRLDVLCNNAGVMAIPRAETADGFEMQLGVNHLGHFALTGHLLSHLVGTEGETRVVTHSSGAHSGSEIQFDDLHSERSYGKWAAYGQSKLANLLFAYELQRRLDRAGIETVNSIACHPGYADTNLQFRGPEAAGSRLRYGLMRVANALLAQPAERGALPLLYAATAPPAEGGAYYGPGGLLNMRGSPEKQTSGPASYDEDAAARLWEVSEELTGVTYDVEAVAAARA